MFLLRLLELVAKVTKIKSTNTKIKVNFAFKTQELSR